MGLQRSIEIFVRKVRRGAGSGNDPISEDREALSTSKQTPAVKRRLLPRQVELALHTVGSHAAVRVVALATFIVGVVNVARDPMLATLLLVASAVLTAKEITSRHNERELLDSVLDAATEIAMIATDLDGNITIFNKGAESMLGYDAAEMVGLRSLDVLHDVDELSSRSVELGVSLGPEALIAPAKSGRPSTGEWTYLHKDGRRLTVSLAITVLRKRAGKIVGFLGMAADVTRQKEHERERERLLWIERELTQRLLSQNDELVRMDRTKDEFVATVSHEFRTPLTSIKGYLETLLDGDAGPLNEDQQHFLRTIERNSRRLGRLVEDLLFAARVDAGGASVAVLTEVDLADLITEVVDTALPQAKAKRINLNCDLSEGLVVAADPARLSQLLDNLTSNAIKFTPEGGDVSIELRRHDDDAIVKVKDTGIGIPKDEQSRLFRRFFRSRLATEHAIAGTGIGLAIVKEIAEAHGATVEVESTEGMGTTFKVVMPILISLSTG